jgi:hypothetical protein
MSGTGVPRWVPSSSGLRRLRRDAEGSFAGHNRLARQTSAAVASTVHDAARCRAASASLRFHASAHDTRGGITGIVGREEGCSTTPDRGGGAEERVHHWIGARDPGRHSVLASSRARARCPGAAAARARS